jgi:DNA gyrase subunit A
MQNSFLEYAYSVIYSRALPDARDGLKPVQRRILYQMAMMGLRPERGHVKSARVVGEVMGRLHPHGDAAIYDALVRMAQDFSLRLPLVDGHGNFGSPDDGPAAMRYTECRLASAAQPMTESLDENVVDFEDNYDGREREPSVLPAAIPNLLVNGASGIAVGMATNIAPHNLVEVVDAARYLLDHPKASLAKIMEFLPAPDLPTGGTIIDLPAVKEAYETGRGQFRVQAKAVMEKLPNRKIAIVVTELPPNVGPERVIARIKTLVESKKISGIARITDLTDMEQGLHVVIELKSSAEPELVLADLYRLTPMEESFAVNTVALVEGRPRTLGLLEMLRVFLEHRVEVVRRRSDFRRSKAKDRLHLVEGLLVAILNIDKVIATIRKSDDAESARTALRAKFDLTIAQADYILETPLRRLTRLSQIEVEKERDELTAAIKALTAILADEAKLRKVVSDELAGVAKQFGTPRRTQLSAA